MKKYLIDNELYEEEDFRSILEEEVSNYVESNYDDILDELYAPYSFGSFEIYASEILSKCDPVAYRCGISDEISYRLDCFEDELEIYGECTVNGVNFRIEDEADEADEEDEEE